jgi:predicted permease
LDARVLVFTMLATAAAALVFGLAPAVAAFVSAPADALRHGRAAQPGSRRVFGSGLVIGQVAMSLALLSVAHLYIDHLRDLRGPSLGFDRDGVLLLSVDNARAQNRQQLTALYQDLVPRLQAIPGVRSVASSGTTPLSMGAASRFLRAEGYDEPAASQMRVALNWVSPHYFATYGTPLLAGREFRESDTGQPRLVVVNQAVARRYFAGRDAVGRHIWLENEREPYEIVGVAGDAKYSDIHVKARETVYVFAPMSRGPMELSLRTGGRTTAVAADARRVVTEALGSGSVRGVTTLTEQVDAAIVPERLMATLSGFFGFAGALLAAIGLYGLMAYGVARRTREIGIRIALGATRRDVIRMVLTNAAGLVACGLLIGAPVAFWSTRVAATMLEDLPAGGIAPIGIGVAAMIAVALAAACVPARRANLIIPLIVGI